MAKAKEVNKTKELVNELHGLFLRTDSEIAGRGLFYRIEVVLNNLAGSIDKNTEQLHRVKNIIEALKKLA